MSKTAQMTFKKGDGLTKFFYILSSYWSPGGILRFGAKAVIDNDPTDALAVINKSFTDSSIMQSTDPFYKTGYVGYKLPFLPTDIVNVSFDSTASKKVFKGEFQFTPQGGVPVSYPKDNEYIVVTIYADVIREAS